MSRFRTLRGRLTALGVAVAVLAIAILTVAFNVILSSRLRGDVDNEVRAQAAAVATTAVSRDGRLRLREPAAAGLDQRVWLFQGRRAVERPAADAELQRKADALAGRAGAFDDIEDRARLYAAPVRAGGRQVGTVVAAISLAPYDRTTDVALIASLVLGLVLAAAVGGVTWITIGRALAPVREMTRSAAAWSEHEPARRFGARGRPDELGELARTFDDLLDRVAASLRHEQRLSAELSHELRTPLSRIVGEVELLQRRERTPAARAEAYDAITRSSTQMSAILETLMTVARVEGGLEQGRTDVCEALAGLRRTWQPVMARRGVTLDVGEAPGGLVAGVDAGVVERIVAPLLDNAGRHARSAVSVRAAARDGTVVLTISDDGPGVPVAARETIFEPGTRLAGASDGGAGLGLALARRLARAANGDVVAAAAAGADGARFEVALPR
jgi:two-component system heavy metal sensor histidine kinase CusS